MDPLHSQGLSDNASLLGAGADDGEIARYATLLDSLGIGLAAYDVDGRLALRNRSAEQSLADCHDLEPLLATVRQAIAGKQAAYDQIVRLDCATVGPSWLSVNTLPVFAGDGGLRRVLATLDDITDLHEVQFEISRLTTQDQLTGVCTANVVMKLLDNEIRRAQRYGTPFTVALIDIDHFRPLCTEHGIAQGDAVLAGVGQLLEHGLRELDIVGRVGHDQFLAILPNVSLKDAAVGMERVRGMIEDRRFAPGDVRVTVSVGVSEYAGESADALFERARSLLQNARDGGRNRLWLDLDLG